MDTILDQLIADFHERDRPDLTRRHTQLPWLPNKIDTVMGMRRLPCVIEYYKTKSGRKVDFIIRDWEGQKALIQVAAKINVSPFTPVEVGT